MEANSKNRESRPPVVVVMGHVDHGKTTLLDYIRKASVAAREAGGITQAVGAYEIVHGTGAAARKITFIDTPGHEAFRAMRSRGAQAADLAILIVAADESVKPQTREAITILQEAKIPFVVALNKIDKANPAAVEKTKGDLMSAGVMLEGYGGQISWHGISAKTGEGVDDLLDLVLLAADVEDLFCDPAAPASGFVLEALRDPRRGVEATVILKNGVLRRGDRIATPSASGKVKILEDFLRRAAPLIEPSAPAIVIGFESLPKVGEPFTAGEAAAASAMKAAVSPVRPAGVSTAVSGAAGSASAGGAAKSAFNIILKASDAGSLEALSVVIQGVSGAAEKGLAIVEESVGDVTDGDVRHAMATGSIIIGFKTRIDKGAQNLAEAQSVKIITSKIVYDLEKAVGEFLERGQEATAGELEILAIFNQEKTDKQLVGGRVLRGSFRTKAGIEIDRAGTRIGAGRVIELRERKAEIPSADVGKEIGVLLNAGVPVQVGDRLVIKK